MWLENPGRCIPCERRALEAAKRTEGLEDWFLLEEVKEICEPCYQSMLNNNIKRIRKSVLLEKINRENLMKFTEVIFLGQEGQRFNLGGISLRPNEPIYFTESELPVPLDLLKTFKEVKVNELELPSKPNAQDVMVKKAQLAGAYAVMWIGTSGRRTNNFGTFIKNEVVQVSKDCYDYCKTNDGFKCF